MSHCVPKVPMLAHLDQVSYFSPHDGALNSEPVWLLSEGSEVRVGVSAEKSPGAYKALALGTIDNH